MNKSVSIKRQIKTREVRARMAELAGDHKVAKKERDAANKLRNQQDIRRRVSKNQ